MSSNVVSFWTPCRHDIFLCLRHDWNMSATCCRHDTECRRLGNKTTRRHPTYVAKLTPINIGSPLHVMSTSSSLYTVTPSFVNTDMVPSSAVCGLSHTHYDDVKSLNVSASVALADSFWNGNFVTYVGLLPLSLSMLLGWGDLLCVRHYISFVHSIPSLASILFLPWYSFLQWCTKLLEDKPTRLLYFSSFQWLNLS